MVHPSRPRLSSAARRSRPLLPVLALAALGACGPVYRAGAGTLQPQTPAAVAGSAANTLQDGRDRQSSGGLAAKTSAIGSLRALP